MSTTSGAQYSNTISDQTCHDEPTSSLDFTKTRAELYETGMKHFILTVQSLQIMPNSPSCTKIHICLPESRLLATPAHFHNTIARASAISTANLSTLIPSISLNWTDKRWILRRTTSPRETVRRESLHTALLPSTPKNRSNIVPRNLNTCYIHLDEQALRVRDPSYNIFYQYALLA